MADYGILAVPDGVGKDPGNSDKIAADVSMSIEQAMAKMAELWNDTIGQGGVIGDLMPVTDSPNVASTQPGGSDPEDEPTGNKELEPDAA